jgi:hypothetical protein
MAYISRLLIFIILISYSFGSYAGQAPSGTKGQNFDRLVFELSTDDEVEVLAKVMTINRHPTSSSAIAVTDNGVAALAPTQDSAERWSRKIPVRGKGRHEIVMICSNTNSEPVYCMLRTADARATPLN